MRKLIADVLLVLECWRAKRVRVRERREARRARESRAKVQRGVLGILGR